jgi:hypothetical protein
LLAGLLLGEFLSLPSPALGEVSKGRRILIERGLQVHGLATRDDVFHLDTYQSANYTAIHWLWDADPSQHGAAPGFPWARWVRDENQMPGAAEQAYRSQLVALQLGDEWHLNDAAVRNRAVNWLNGVRAQWPDTILYMNNFGGQVSDAALADFVARARPDMLCFDAYPFRSDYASRTPNAPAYGSPTSWYGDLRRYRVFALNADVPLAVYRQTFHAVQDYDQTVYRDPSPSEMNLNTFGALAFGATTLIDFTYNTGASSLFTPPGGDSNPTPAFAQQTTINRRARNFGRSLVRLVGADDHPDGGQPTTDVMFIRGRTGPNNADRTPLPIGFVPDNAAPNSFSEWEADRNDPFLRGWVVNNLGTKNSGLPGDVIISWFKPLDSTLDDPDEAADQIYLFVVNAFTGPDGAAGDYRQRIRLNFLNGVGTSIQRLNPDTGEVELTPLAQLGADRRQLDFELDGGEGQLFKFNTGDPFVGVEPSADFDLDGDVDGADLLRWQQGLAAAAEFGQGDANFDLRVDGADLAIWKAQSEATRPAGRVVPEPVTWLMAGLACGLPLATARCCR